MKIYLIRHGESTGDIDNLYGGDYDDHLTEKGISQAKELSKKLKDKKIEIIFSSPRFRATETAELLQNALKCKLEFVNDLRERNFYGFLTGTNKEEAKKNHPKEVEQLKDFNSTIKDAEPYYEFRERVENAIKHILSAKNKAIAIVTHGGPISLIFRELLSKEITRLHDCAVVELEFDKELKLMNLDGAEVWGQTDIYEKHKIELYSIYGLHKYI